MEPMVVVVAAMDGDAVSWQGLTRRLFVLKELTDHDWELSSKWMDRNAECLM